MFSLFTFLKILAIVHFFQIKTAGGRLWPRQPYLSGIYYTMKLIDRHPAQAYPDERSDGVPHLVRQEGVGLYFKYG